MKRREQARRIALQALYQLDLTSSDLGDDIVAFLRESTADPEIYFFARELTEGTWGWRGQADPIIDEAAEHWQVDRMAVLDRNVLRLATWELAHHPNVPERVALDQAIELAKTFSAAESSKFVNGVLDKVLKILKGRGLRAEAPPAADAAADGPPV